MPRGRPPKHKKKGNPPSHILKVGTYNAKGKSVWHRVGAAWERDDGSLAIRLDACTVLDWRDLSGNEDSATLFLFTNDES